MNYLYISTLILAFTVCACDAAHAQGRKPALPVDTGVSELQILDLLYRPPPREVSVSPESGFACVFPPQPEYPGGTNAMYKFIAANLRMPRAAKRAGVTGRVFLSFMIEATGEITHVGVLKGIGFGCDEEAVRLVESMPKWKPGKQDGKPVRAKYNLPISFVAQ